MRDLDELFEALGRSSFRMRFRLGKSERAYLNEKGVDEILVHARRFIADRLAPADPPNDGKQTPWRGHPVFVAQHATATCCRGCLAKWHGLEKGRPLTSTEVDHVLRAIERWLRTQLVGMSSSGQQLSLFNG